MWVRFFSTCRACAQLFEVARYRASKLASGRNHISVDESPTSLSFSGLFRLIFLLLPSLYSSPSSLYPLVSAARTDDALKLKTLEMGHSRHLFLSLSFFLLLSSSFFPCSVLRRMPSWKGSRTERKSQSFRRMPFKLFIRISRSWGRAMTGRSNECGVNRLQETQKITSWYEAREETSLSWLNEQEPSVSLKDPRWFLIQISRVVFYLSARENYAVSFEKY